MQILKNNKVFIIAEAGVNHNGSLDLAKKLVDAAVDAKVDAVKFQTFISENVISKNAVKADYQKSEIEDKKETQLEMVKKLELSFNNFIELKDYCDSKNIIFLSTAFDNESVDFLKKLNLGIWKVPSGDINNLPFLQKIGSFNEEIIISTGMSNLSEIETALSVLIKSGSSRKNITILHCNTEYPTPMIDVNLQSMLTIKNAFSTNIGYSDHTLGTEVSLAAVALGAKVIEKHFTLDKSLPGPDHKASLEPDELISLVKSIRNIEIALGSNIKSISKSEFKNKSIARKSIHLATDISKGQVLELKHLIAKRPGDGISPMLINHIVGSYAKKNISFDAKLDLTDIEWK